MRDRRVIYDSEEDNEGLSPLNSPVQRAASEVVRTADNDTQGHYVDHQIGDSRSTDPDFFKQVYEEQKKAAAGPVSDSNQDSQAQNGSSDKLKSPDSKAKNNSSSITDPTLKSSRKRILGKADTTELGNLTQVTTPSATSAKQKDVYDFSLSDEEGAAEPAALQSKAKAARTSSKRKRGQSDNPHPHLAPAMSSPPKVAASNQRTRNQEDESLRPTRKKRTSALDQSVRQVPDDVDLLVIPTTASLTMSEPVDETNMNHSGQDPDNGGPETRDTQIPSHGRPPAYVFFDPPEVLTSSQKKQYLCVSSSSELDLEDKQQQASLPLPKPEQTKGQRSTGTSISTIAYTTPSRYASSVAPLPLLGTFEGPSSNVETSAEERTQLDKAHPHSSPDELNAFPTAPKYKRLMSAVEEEDELAQHDAWDSDKIGYSRETYVPRPSRCRSGANQDSPKQTSAEYGGSIERKKRQKTGGPIETAHKDPWDSDKVGFHREHYVPRTSRRRSRVLMDDDEEMQHTEQSMPDTCPPGDESYGKTGDAGLAAISSSQQAPDQATEGIEGVDPDFWAAMPDDIRQELRSQQQAVLTSQASRPRRTGRPSEAMSSLLPVQEATPQPKKRGRKKKEAMIMEAPVAFDEPAAAIEEPEARPSPAPHATAKRKRGRPRKAEVNLASPPCGVDKTAPATEATKVSSEATEEPSATHALANEPLQDIIEAPKAPAKRGRKKKAVEVPSTQMDEPEDIPHAEQETNDTVESMGELAVGPPHFPVDTSVTSVEIEDRKALRDISNSANNLECSPAMKRTAEETGTNEVEQQQEVTPEPKAKEVPKSASTPGQQGKVPLRVGLSKRSRIAPLLKVIRK